MSGRNDDEVMSMAVMQRKVDRFDKRLMERRIEKGVVTSNELESHITDLPDLSDNLAVVETQIESSEASGEDEEE